MPVILGGNTGIYLASLAPSVDPDAQAFITAASITDPTQQSAVNQLVVDLKGYNIWTKMKALYPFVGGTAAQHKWNLKDPRDLDVAFRLVFNGGWTHSANGATPNGTNGWADTFVVLNTLTRDSNSTGIYIRTNVAEDKTDYGMFDTGANGSLQFGARSLGNLIGLRNGSNQVDTTANSDSRGFFQMTRRNSSEFIVSKNITKTTITRAATDTFGNANKIPLGCLEFGGKNFFSSKQFALFYIGNTSLNDTELDNLYTAVQAFQTTLGRSIGTQTVSDADAQAFVTNAGIVDQVEANAVNNLVIGLKADGLWTKMKAVYPMVGGSNTSTSYNLRNTAQYQISWAGGVTSSANGVTVATNGYGNTAFNMSTQITSVNSWAVGVYVNQYTAGGIDLGADLNGLDNFYHSIKWDGFWGANTGRFSTNSALAFTDTNGLGLTVSTRNSALNKKVYKSGSEIANANTASAGSFFNGNVFLGALNRNGSASFYSGKRYAFAFICDGSLNATENTNLNTRVTTFQTTLNRL